MTEKGRDISMLLSQKRLRQILGVLWLIDGLLQLQPAMFTMNMVNKVMDPTASGQPGLIAASLNWIIAVTTQNLIAINLLIVVAQIILGILLIAGLWVRGTVIISIIWALIVWYGGEGMSMLLTGQASALTGAPGAVLLYPLLGLAIYPQRTPNDPSGESNESGLLSRLQLRWILAGFWVFVALLQLQPYWWQDGQISEFISGMTGQGGLDGILLDPMFNVLAIITVHVEVVLNVLLIIIFLALGIGLAVVKQDRVRPWLIASILVSVLLWWGAQGFGMILTGMATDFNSGLLLIVMALGCWPKASLLQAARKPSIPDAKQTGDTVQTA
jgi:hypothetical protein